MAGLPDRVSRIAVAVVLGGFHFNAIGVLAADDMQSLRSLKPFQDWELVGECPQNTVRVIDKERAEVEFCLRFDDRELRRCEIALHGRDLRDRNLHISFDLMIPSGWTETNRWASVMQIHSFPDPSEAWRCPPVSLEVAGRSLRMFNRWDRSPVSDTSLATCALDHGGTMQSRVIFDALPFTKGEWMSINLNVHLSTSDRGQIGGTINGFAVPRLTGPNIFNDQKSPYMKFGIYKPSGFDNENTYCVRYRNITIGPFD